MEHGHPIPAYRKYEQYKPISRVKFINLCKNTLSSGVLKNTMNCKQATLQIEKIIRAFETGKTENIFGSAVPGVSMEKRAERKRIPIHEISKDYPDIVFGVLDEVTESEHISWLSDYIKYRKSVLQQDYADISADLKDLSRDLKYMDRGQRFDASTESLRIRRLKNDINHDIEKTSQIALEPFFARLDYNNLSKGKNKIIYIAKVGGVGDYPSKKDVNYANWRAPVGDLFYRTSGSLGKTHFSGDDIEVVLNDRIVVRGGKLMKLGDDIVGSSGILQEKLSQSSSSKMNEVVETIQVEQNEIIRHTGNQDLIIQGAAGSGKTIIGLHRIAYLMYSESINNGSTLFISPNEKFSNYISDVLPELGENNMPIVTMDSIINMILKNIDTDLSAESFSEFLEGYFNNGFSKSAAKKYSNNFSSKYMQFIANINKKPVIFDLNLVMKSPNIEANKRKKELSKICRSLIGVRELTECRKYENAILAAGLWAKINNIELRLRPKTKSSEDTNSSYELCSENDQDKIEKAKEGYNDLKKSVWKKAEQRKIEYEGSKKEGTEIEYEYRVEAIENEQKSGNYWLFAHEYKKKDYYPTSEHRDVLHIVVDEAQDYSPWHLYLLKTVFPKAHFTILGDENQNLNPYFMNSKLADLLPGADYISVKKAYRSSPEIIEYTNKILGEKIHAVRNSNNIPVTELHVDSFNAISKELISEAICDASKHNFKNIAIICRTLEQKHRMQSIIQGYISGSSANIENLTVYEAKGLEFDSAIVIDTYLLTEKELLYTACTRARHQLIVCKIGKNSKKFLLSKIFKI